MVYRREADCSLRETEYTSFFALSYESPPKRLRPDLDEPEAERAKSLRGKMEGWEEA